MVNAVNDYFGLSTGTSTVANSGLYSSNYGIYSTGTNDSSVWLQQQYNNTQLSNSFTNKTNAQSSVIYDKIDVIANLISEGEEDQVLEQYSSLLDSMRSQSQYQGLSEEELSSMAKQAFKARTGVDMSSAVKENCRSDFGTGFHKTFNGLMGADSTSAEDIISEIDGTKKKSGSGIAKFVGGVLGTVASVCTLGLSQLFSE